jgi:hypothetical protein
MHTRQDSSRGVISESQRPLPAQNTNARAQHPCPQQNSNPHSQQSATEDIRFIWHVLWDRRDGSYMSQLL